MLEGFIPEVKILSFPFFKGVIATCSFRSEFYQDIMFRKAGIHWHKSLDNEVVKRCAEYLAGRFLVKYLCSIIGFPAFQLQPGTDRAPKWPDGIIGSISHNNDTALCALGHLSQFKGMGVDVESLVLPNLVEILWKDIIHNDEYKLISKKIISNCLIFTFIFSAKESLFKTLYPQVKKYFIF